MQNWSQTHLVILLNIFKKKIVVTGTDTRTEPNYADKVFCFPLNTHNNTICPFLHLPDQGETADRDSVGYSEISLQISDSRLEKL